MSPASFGSTVAYFSMEIALDKAVPTYSGGLGVLAGDTLRSAADLSVPVVGITLLHRKGYFQQHLDEQGNQSEAAVVWNPEELLEPVEARTQVMIEGRTVHVRAWKYPVRGVTGHVVPVYLLDTQLPENSEWDRTLTDCLYGGDNHYRLCQEIVLGMGGASLLRSLECPAQIYHLNEGHSALLTLCLLEWQLDGRQAADLGDADLEAVRRKCVFTTHTPVPAGHDKFAVDVVRSVMGDEKVALLEAAKCLEGETLNMTYLALRLARWVNGVAMKHREVSQGMFPNFPVDAITNGVHAATWTSPAFQKLLDKRIPEWRTDNLYLRYAVGIPLQEIRAAHAEAKQTMIAAIAERTPSAQLDPKVFTIGFARRATPYKRADLLFADPARLAEMAANVGPIQIVFGGKAHPNDGGGKDLIRRIHEAAASLAGQVTVVYVENYEMSIAARIVAGVDLWLNNPMKPLEASGTSGMKAALNGVPSLSVLDGWWIEGHVEGVTGWSIGGVEPDGDQSKDANEIYIKLERIILPLYYGLPFAYAEVMRASISLNGSFFNTQRMVEQYVRNAYFPEDTLELASVV
jgi:starch phosphorylase